MKSLNVVFSVVLALTMAYTSAGCQRSKAKPVKVEKKTPPPSTGDDGTFKPGGDPADQGTNVDKDPSVIQPSASPTPNVVPVTPQPSPSPTVAPTVAPTPGPTVGPVPAGDEITVTLSDGTTKTIKWDGLSNMDSTGKFKITNQ